MPLKKCSKCELHKDTSQFNKDASKPDGLYSSCKACVNLARRKTYGRDSQRWKERKRKNQDYVYDYLSDRCCEECGESDIIVLQFDHIEPENKVATVSDLASGSFERLIDEIDKCRILCANCHTRHTAQQFNWYVLDYLVDKQG